MKIPSWMDFSSRYKVWFNALVYVESNSGGAEFSELRLTISVGYDL